MTNYFTRLRMLFYIGAIFSFFILLSSPQLSAEQQQVPSGETIDLIDDTQDLDPNMEEAGIQDPSMLGQPEQAPVPEDITYTVKKGDSLYVIAKKNGVTVGNLKKANNLQSDLIKPGMELKIPKGVFSIVVDKSDNTLQLLLNNQTYKTYSVSTGKENSTPNGEFKVTDKLENPTWYTAGAVVEPGSPENILGTRWIGYSLKGYGIHGTTLPETIGTQASAGCVRMLNSDVEELYELVIPGTVVKVQD